MRLRLIILKRNGGSASHLELGSGRLAIALLLAAGTLTSALWLGWKIGELSF